LERRFANPETRHRTWQVAADGSQKLPQRFGAVLSATGTAGRDPGDICMVLAAWVRYVSGRDCDGAPIDVRDPLAEALARDLAGAGNREAAVAAALGRLRMMDATLAAVVVPRVAERFEALTARGVVAALEEGAR
jgi:fructuronate reductase